MSNSAIRFKKDKSALDLRLDCIYAEMTKITKTLNSQKHNIRFSDQFIDAVEADLEPGDKG